MRRNASRITQHTVNKELSFQMGNKPNFGNDTKSRAVTQASQNKQIELTVDSRSSQRYICSVVRQKTTFDLTQEVIGHVKNGKSQY